MGLIALLPFDKGEMGRILFDEEKRLTKFRGCFLERICPLFRQPKKSFLKYI
jgi:hypothetical protein